MRPWIEGLSELFPARLATSHLLLLLQWLGYFLIGRAVNSAVAGRTAPRSRYVVAYVIVGAAAWHALAFVALFAGVPGIIAAHVVAGLPFVALLIAKRRAAFEFDRRWAAVATVIVIFIAAAPASELFHARPAAWDEFTQWAVRPRQLFLLDRLARSGDSAAVVAPYYGLHTTLIASWTYALHRREAYGAAASWTLLTVIATLLHCYEYLRGRGISAPFAGPACTLLLIGLCRGRTEFVTTLYADAFIMCGGLLALLHGSELLCHRGGESNPREEGVLAAAGFCILTFTKATGWVIAAAVLLSILIALLLRRDRPPMSLRVARRLIPVLIPCLILLAVWFSYAAAAYPGSDRMVLEQGETPTGKLGGSVRNIAALAVDFAVELRTAPPFSPWLIAWVAALILGTIRRRKGGDSGGPSPSLAAALFPAVTLVAFLVVYMGSAQLPVRDLPRYVAAILPAAMIYTVERVSVALRPVRGAANAAGAGRAATSASR